MSTSVLPVALGADIIQPIEPRRKRTHHKKPGGAVEKQSSLIDVTFWAKKTRVDQECRNDSGEKQASGKPENTPTQANSEGEQKERPNHPRWNPKGSTIVRIDGRDIDWQRFRNVVADLSLSTTNSVEFNTTEPLRM